MEYQSFRNNVVNKLISKEEEALTKVGMFVKGQARINLTENQSIDTGDLRRSMSYVVDMQKKSVTIGSILLYAVYIEKGTGIYAVDGNGRQTPWSYRDGRGNFYTTEGQEAKPYLEIAVTDNHTAIKEIFKRILGEVGSDWRD